MTKQPERSHADQWKEIEDKHFGRCIWQVILPSKTIMVELLQFPAAETTALVVKHFDRRIPTGSAGKWPEQTATYVYLPVDDSNTWGGLDKALTDLKVTPRAA